MKVTTCAGAATSRPLCMRDKGIGLGINKLFIAEIPHISDPEHRPQNLVAFIVVLLDTSQVRIQPHGDRDPMLLYVELPGPSYDGHIAPLTERPPSSRRCEGRLVPASSSPQL